MRSLFLLALGLAVGATATVLFFTLDPSFQAGTPDHVGGGNARLSLDEDALSAIATQQLRGAFGFTRDAVVTADVRENNLLTFAVVIGAGVAGIRTSITVDPEIVDGRLKLQVVEANLGELAVPADVAALIEAPLQARLDALAGGLDYRLTSIITADNQLVLEVRV